MHDFDKLLEVADRLLGPDGCPWDREQTFFTLQPYLLEETHELMEAIDLNEPKKVVEELGDVLYALIFIAKLGERDGLFSLGEAVRIVTEKLIRRHPHVFGKQKISSTQDVVDNWEKVKKSEGKKNPIENIPPTLPALARAQKVITKLKRDLTEERLAEDVGQRLWDLVKEAAAQNIDAESALRRTTLMYEENYKKHRR